MKGISVDKYADFAIEDTSKVIKIFIADNYGTTLLERRRVMSIGF